MMPYENSYWTAKRYLEAFNIGDFARCLENWNFQSLQPDRHASI